MIPADGSSGIAVTIWVVGIRMTTAKLDDGKQWLVISVRFELIVHQETVAAGPSSDRLFFTGHMTAGCYE